MLVVSWTETRMLVGSERPAVSPSERRPSRPNARATLIPGALNATPASPLAWSPLSLDGLGLPAPCGSGRGLRPHSASSCWGRTADGRRLCLSICCRWLPQPQGFLRAPWGTAAIRGYGRFALSRAHLATPCPWRGGSGGSAPPLRHPAAHDDCAHCLPNPARTGARPCQKSTSAGLPTA